MALIKEAKTLDPAENLRREETYTRSGQGQAARVWRNSECVVLGRFLEAECEVDLEKTRLLGVPVLRRSSGGGAVYHDTGNINYSLYLDTADVLSSRVEESLMELSWPITRLLESLDIPWTWVPPNNIYVLDRKISGSSEARHGGRLLHHGTLLVETDLNMMRLLLKNGGRSMTAPVINMSWVIPGLRVEQVEEALAAVISTGSQESGHAMIGNRQLAV